MKICISVRDAQADDLIISSHFGDSTHFVLIDSTTEEIQPFPAHGMSCRGPCRCYIPDRQNGAFGAVICRAIGHRELLDLRRKDIPVYLTQETSPIEALQRWRENRLGLVLRSTCLKGRRKSVGNLAARKMTHATSN